MNHASDKKDCEQRFQIDLPVSCRAAEYDFIVARINRSLPSTKIPARITSRLSWLVELPLFQ